MKRKRHFSRQERKGAITVMAAVLAIVLVGMVAFCVDIGYVLSAKEELQRSADASALAACWEYGQKLSQGNTSANAAQMARSAAVQYALLNKVTNNPMIVDPNTSNSPNGDVVFGYIANFNDPASAFQTGNPSLYNSARVTMYKNSSSNGEVPYFFARVFGMTGQILSATATAGIIRDIKGFQIPSNGGNINILPFALDQTTWNNLANNTGPDQWKWNSQTKHVESGSDGLTEVNLYPQGTGSPGNRGTIDIGGANNSTADITRQIHDGISPADLAHHGGKLEFDANGKLYLNGDTGISAGVKDDLAAIIGQPRIIPIFATVAGNGNNANYTIVKWQGIRITDVKLTGAMSQKHVTIQVCPVLTTGVIQGITSGTSPYVYSPVVLVR